MLHSLLDAPEEREQVGGAPLEVGIADITEFVVLDDDGVAVNGSTTGSRLTAQITVKAHRDIERPFAGLTIDGPRGDVIFHHGNRHAPYPPLRAGEQRTFSVDWTAQFPTGSYVVRIFIAKVEAVAEVTVLSNADPIALYVQGDHETYGVVDVQADFGAGS
jgi:hypothetical protein